MNTTLINEIKLLGLTDKEAAVYLTLLSLTKAPVHKIASASKLNRSTCYIVLESLKEKGFAVESQDPELRCYEACPPQELLKKAAQRTQESEAMYESIISTTEELGAHTLGAQAGTRASFFETEGGLKTVQHEIDTALKKESVCGIAHEGNVEKKLEAAQNAKVIIATKNIGRKRALKNTYYIPYEQYPVDSQLFIFGNVITLLSESEAFAVRIESAQFAEVTREAFNLAWKEAERLNNLKYSNKLAIRQ